ncbi:MAG: methyl-accepting chemotaxis protein [Cyanobacteriota bacterium]|nr:methyl-accepting chemotaxis protein [Cyanobacteriota bacterium]
MFENIKLRTRLLLGYGVHVVLFLGLAGVMYGTTTKVLGTLKEIEKVQAVIIDVNKATLYGEKMVRSFRGYLAVQNEVFIEEYNEGAKLFDAALESIEELINTPEKEELLGEMKDVKNDFQFFADRVILLVKEGKQNEAVSVFNTGKGKEFVDEFEKLSNQFAALEKIELEEETQGTQKNLIILLWLLSIGSTLLILISIIVAVKTIGNISKKINQVTENIVNFSTGISTTIIQQELTAAQQASSVNETTTTMDELGASSQTTAEQAAAAVAAAKKALNLAEEGTEAVDISLEGMASLSEKVGAIAQQIARLSEQTNQIGNISQLVSDLANQTNMLALNAAVEAVRAGEHGKGFTIVASEIRKLADESRKSAEKIYTLVFDIQTLINSTVMATEAGTQNVESGVKISQQAATAFNGVKEAINNVVLNNQQISFNVKQQALAIQQVVDAMNELNTGAQETASGLGQTKQGVEKLNEVSKELKSIV